MNLRPYQDKGITDIARKFASGTRKVVFQLATGGGKTVIFSAISDRYYRKSGKSILILCHRKELLQQTRRTLHSAFGINAQPIVAGMKFIPDAPVYVGMIESVNRRMELVDKKNIGLVIIDECHIASFHKIHDFFPTQFILGVTATPLSANKKKPLKLYYDDIVVCDSDIPELIKDGYLAQNLTWAPEDTVNRANLTISRSTGDFDEALMALQFSKPRYINNTVQAYEKWAKDTKTLIFNVTIEHSIQVAQAFIEAGYDARILDSNMPDDARDNVLDWFRNTRDAILCNVGITTTGFDEPTVETVMANKSTTSMPFWIQICGRGSRPIHDKRNFTIIDMGGNALVHGDWNQKRDWYDIFFNPAKAIEGVAPVKSCPQCEAIIPARIMECPYCGYVFPVKERELEEELGDFIVVTKNVDVKRIMQENEHRKEYFIFFKLGEDLAKQAKGTIPALTPEIAEFIFNKYCEKISDWMREWNIKHPEAKKKRLNAWHLEKAGDHLFNELKKQFPKWTETSLKSATMTEG